MSVSFIGKRPDLPPAVNEQADCYLGGELPEVEFYTSLGVLPRGLIVENCGRFLETTGCGLVALDPWNLGDYLTVIS